MLGPCTPLEKPRAKFGISVSKTERGPFYIGATKRQSEAIIQLIYVSQKILELGYATELYHIGCAKYEKSHQKKMARTRRRRRKGPQGVYFTLFRPLDKNPNMKYKVYN